MTCAIEHIALPLAALTVVFLANPLTANPNGQFVCRAPKAGTKTKPGASEAKPLKLLAGGNPPIAQANGDAPVLAGMTSRERATGKPASRLIDRRIRNLAGWRGETLAACER